MPNCIVLIGAQGSGKSTLINYFESIGFYSIGMSNIINKKATFDKGFAEKYKIKGTMGSGSLVNDEAVISVFNEELLKVGVEQDIILDGCVRTPDQARAFIMLLRSRFHILFIKIDCSIETSLRRIEFRRMEEERVVKDKLDKGEISDIPTVRSDNTPAAIKERLNLFYKNLPKIEKELMVHGYSCSSINGEQEKGGVVADAMEIFSDSLSYLLS